MDSELSGAGFQRNKNAKFAAILGDLMCWFSVNGETALSISECSALRGLSRRSWSVRLNNPRLAGDYQESDQSGDERYPAYEHTSHHQFWTGAIAAPRAMTRRKKGRIPHEGPYAEQHECLPQAEWLPYHCESIRVLLTPTASSIVA